MEGKLIKMVEGYTLSLTGSVDDLYGISNNQLAEEHQLQKLSLKNCQVIENDYDLDELASSLVDRETNANVDSSYRKTLEKYVKIGLQKALEIRSDKKFSEDELKLAFFHVQNKPTFAVFKESLQQTEWEVEIEMEEYLDDSLSHIKGEMPVFKKRPKLDANGCLILKRK